MYMHVVCLDMCQIVYDNIMCQIYTMCQIVYDNCQF